MVRLFTLLAFIFFTSKPSKSQGICDTIIVDESTCIINLIDDKTNTLISVIHEVNDLESRKNKLKQEIRYLDSKIKEKKLLDSVLKHSEKGY